VQPWEIQEKMYGVAKNLVKRGKRAFIKL
jgi:hypothetical protein